MAILETLNLEPDEAALGRFFDVIDRPYQWDDLEKPQQVINDLADHIKLNGVEDQAPVEALEAVMSDLRGKILNHDGWLVMALHMPAVFTQDRMKQLVADYSVSQASKQQAVVFVPIENITAMQLNPQLYGSGVDIRPVINFRVKTSVDEPQTMYGGVEQENLGKWFQVNFAETPLALLSEHNIEPEV